MQLPTLAEVRDMAALAQAHITRHEIDCGKRYVESRRALDDLAGQVERMTRTLASWQAYLLRGAFWIIGILATALGGTALYIFNHLGTLIH